MTLTLSPTQFYTLYSPSRCILRLYLNQEGVRAAPPTVFEETLFRLGQRHEKHHLTTFPVYTDLTGFSFEKTLKEIKRGSPVIYQGELRTQTTLGGQSAEVVGIPDFMIREGERYIIRDCKIARHATDDKHPEIPRQLQVYGWLFENATGQTPLRLEVFLGNREIAAFHYEGEGVALSYLKLLAEIISLSDEPYSPVGWSKCTGCGYHDLCWSRAYKAQDVALVYGIDQNLVISLREEGVFTIKELVERFHQVSLAEFKRPSGKRLQRVGKAARRILLQAKSMLSNREIVLKKPGLPLSPNYVMLDIEGLPPQFDELDKIYLWGMQVCGKRPGNFLYALAETGSGGDKKGWEEFLKIASRIFDEYGDIPFVHWHHYEKIKIKAYIDRYGDRDGIAEHILFNLVDLLPLTRDTVVLPEPSYSLKVVERYIGFQRMQKEYGGDWSIAKYIEAVETDDEAKQKELIYEVIKYNEEDLKATWKAFEWLKRLED